MVLMDKDFSHRNSPGLHFVPLSTFWQRQPSPSLLIVFVFVMLFQAVMKFLSRLV